MAFSAQSALYPALQVNVGRVFENVRYSLAVGYTEGNRDHRDVKLKHNDQAVVLLSLLDTPILYCYTDPIVEQMEYTNRPYEDTSCKDNRSPEAGTASQRS
jgi:hypothetical protein